MASPLEDNKESGWKEQSSYYDIGEAASLGPGVMQTGETGHPGQSGSKQASAAAGSDMEQFKRSLLLKKSAGAERTAVSSNMDNASLKPRQMVFAIPNSSAPPIHISPTTSPSQSASYGTQRHATTSTSLPPKPSLQQDRPFNTWYTNSIGRQEYKVQVGSSRWATLAKNSLDSSELWITAWCPQDGISALITYKQMPSHQGAPLHDITISFIYEDLWGSPPDSVWTQEEWTLVLEEILTLKHQVTGIYVNTPWYPSVPLDGLLQAACEVIPVCSPARMMWVGGGKVSETQLKVSFDWAERVGLMLHLYNITVVLSAEHSIQDVQEVHGDLVKHRGVSRTYGWKYRTVDGQQDIDSREIKVTTAEKDVPATFYKPSVSEKPAAKKPICGDDSTTESTRDSRFDTSGKLVPDLSATSESLPPKEDHTFNTWYTESGKQECRVQVNSSRWATLRKASLNSSRLRIHVWSPQDLIPALSTYSQGALDDIIISFMYEDLWGPRPDSVWTQEEWTPVLEDILKQHPVTRIQVLRPDDTPVPLDGLLRAARGVIQQGHTLSEGMWVYGGKVSVLSETELRETFGWAALVELRLDLSDIAVLLNVEHSIDDIPSVHRTFMEGRHVKWGSTSIVKYITADSQEAYDMVKDPLGFKRPYSERSSQRSSVKVVGQEASSPSMQSTTDIPAQADRDDVHAEHEDHSVHHHLQQQNTLHQDKQLQDHLNKDHGKQDHHRQQYQGQEGVTQHQGTQQEYEQLLHADPGTLSGRFSSGGGELRKLSSDVVLTVPSGVVPKGEYWNFCVKVHTDLMNYNQWIMPTEYIMGPVVECLVDPKKQFQKPVTVAIPLCQTVDNASDVTLLYSTDGKKFQEISVSDNISFDVTGSCLTLCTRHFTKFLIKGKKTVEIRELILTLGASMQFSRFSSTVELRLMSHVNCNGLKDFHLVRQKYHLKDMEEIYNCKVCLPKRKEALNFPKILMELEIKSDYQQAWSILGHAEKEVDGIDILNIDPGTHESEHLHNFTLESKERLDEVSFRMRVTFKYENGIGDVENEFVRTFGRSRQLEENFRDLHINSSLTTHAITNSIMNVQTVEDGPTSRVARLADAIKQEIQDDTVRLVGPTGLGVHAGTPYFHLEILSLKILSDASLQQIKAEPTPAGKVTALIDNLLASSPSKLVLFAWLLVLMDQGHQLQRSLSTETKKWLMEFSKQDIMRQVEDL